MFTGKNWWGASSTQNTRAGNRQMRFGCLPPRNAPVIYRLRARRATSVLGHAPRAGMAGGVTLPAEAPVNETPAETGATPSHASTAALRSRQVIRRRSAPEAKEIRTDMRGGALTR